MTALRQDTVNKLLMTFLAFVAFAVSVLLWGMFQRQFERPPVVWDGVTVMTPSIRVGDKLVLVYRAKVNQQCPTEIRSFIRESDGAVVGRFMTQGGYTNSDHGWKDIPVRILIQNDQSGIFPPIKPGPHTYEATAIRFSPDGMKVDNLIPPARFEIIE